MNITSLNYLCNTCYMEADKTCSGCYQATYCSEKCQQLDWETHKTFCGKDEDKEKAKFRRTLCLQVIEASGQNCIFSYFMRLSLANSKGFLLVRTDWLELEMSSKKTSKSKKMSKFEEIPIRYVTIEELIEQPMFKGRLNKTRECLKEISTRVYKTQYIPVLQLSYSSFNVYLIGSQKAKEYWTAVNKLASTTPLIKDIYLKYMDMNSQATRSKGNDIISIIARKMFIDSFETHNKSTAVSAENKVKPLIVKDNDERSLRKEILHPIDVQTKKPSAGTVDKSTNSSSETESTELVDSEEEN